MAGPLALAPAVIVLGLLVAVAAGYALAQSLGALPLVGERSVGVQAYRDLLGGTSGTSDLWTSFAFTLWVSAASTVLAILLALAVIAWIEGVHGRRQQWATSVFHLNLAIPHIVWALALLLVFSQSGILARSAALVGLIDSPADVPALTGDRFGIGLILHFVSKETPFLVLVGLAVLRAQPRQLSLLADTMGARGLGRVRLVVIPTVAPGLIVAGALVFAFVFGSYEAPIVLGGSSPRMLSIVGLDLFNSPDLAQRPAAMALGVLMTIVIGLGVWLLTVTAARRRA